MNFKIILTSLFIIVTSYISAKTPSLKSYWNEKKEHASAANTKTYNNKVDKKQYLLNETQLGIQYKFHENIFHSCGGIRPERKHFCPDICNRNDTFLKEALIKLKKGTQYANFNPYENYVNSVQENEETFIFWKGTLLLSSFFDNNEWDKSKAIEEIKTLLNDRNKPYDGAIERFVCVAAEAEPAVEKARQHAITRLHEEIENYDQLYQQAMHN